MAVLAAALAGPATASGATLTRVGTEVTYNAVAGETNDLVITDTPFGLRLIETGNKSDGKGITISDQDAAFPGCNVVTLGPAANPSSSQATCPISLGITKVIVDVGDAVDIVSGAGIALPLEVTGGTGADTVTTGSGPDLLHMNDGQADTIDCGAGIDVAEIDPLVIEADVSQCEDIVQPSSVFIAGNRLFYVDGVGVNDDLVVASLGGTTVRFLNSVPMLAGPGCTQAAATEVRCQQQPHVSIFLADGNDKGRLSLNSPETVDLLGGDGDDELTIPATPVVNSDGGEGNDTINNTCESTENPTPDFLTGGPGDDMLPIQYACDDEIFGGEGTDTLDLSGSGGVTLSLDDQPNDDGNIHSDIEIVIGGALHDNITGSSGPNLLIGNQGQDQLKGAGGDDIIVDATTGVAAEANDFDGGPGNDVLVGGPERDRLRGGDGDDVSTGGAGGDTHEGGAGNDVLIDDEGDDTFSGGDGSDIVDFSSAGAAIEVRIDDAANDGAGTHDNVRRDVETVVATPFDDVLVGDDGPQTFQAGDGADALFGEGGADSLNGEAGNDAVAGGSGDDSLAGGDDDDALDGGTGADAFSGGDGNDLADFSTRLKSVSVSLVAGDSDGESGEGDDVGADVERATGGQGDDSLVGNDAANTLTGGIGEDSLAGGGGDDSLDAGDGNDSLDGGAGADQLGGGRGEDIATYAAHPAGVDVSLNDAPDDGVPGEGDNAGSDLEELLGSPFADRLTGDAKANSLLGGEGDDTLAGNAGFDLLQGGGGNDSLDGGDGPDTLEAGPGNDAADGGAGEDIVGGASGNDTVVGGPDADYLSIGTGADQLRSRDGVADIVNCGTDSVADGIDADAIDNLSGDCTPAPVDASFVTISAGSLKLAGGSVAVSVTCRRTSTPCAGTLTLETAGKVKVSKARKKASKRKLKLGSTSFTVPAAATKTVKVKLSQSARKVVTRLGSVRVAARAAGKGVRTASAELTLKAKVNKKKKRSSR